ncbi:MAG: hypothetical protein A2Z17_01010 [Gammaproteobacteria bacterium RBG_16_66_13]|nr:MAG: hypothetical protein A2Z17_01010 [Gammaproteobacteria bacterium RBG_16_66_13]
MSANTQTSPPIHGHHDNMNRMFHLPTRPANATGAREGFQPSSATVHALLAFVGVSLLLGVMRGEFGPRVTGRLPARKSPLDSRTRGLP